MPWPRLFTECSIFSRKPFMLQVLRLNYYTLHNLFFTVQWSMWPKANFEIFVLFFFSPHRTFFSPHRTRKLERSLSSILLVDVTIAWRWNYVSILYIIIIRSSSYVTLMDISFSFFWIAKNFILLLYPVMWTNFVQNLSDSWCSSWTNIWKIWKMAIW